MEFLTVKEVAEMLHSTKRTIERLCKSGYYPKTVCFKHGRYWLFNKQNLFDFLMT